MYLISDIDSEIAKKADELVTNGQLPKVWLVQAVMKNHAQIVGKDADMAICCMNDTVSRRVNKYFSTIKASEEEKPQMPLPGFERLQRRYVINRNEEQTIVSVYDMTDAELEGKAKEMDSMAEGCYAHADELRRFKDERQKAS